MNPNYRTIFALIILGTLILAGTFWYFLPTSVPMQWAADGSVNYTLSKNIAVLILPLLCLILGLQGWKNTEYKFLIYAGIALLGISGLFLYIIVSV
ncbi:DUF1648 domain-containing protein [Enterococcus sp. AZ072]|uniref:DUF1648 domain-containing protein n=1 Tax=unclassified Enterococcus TaxID=2608891 RepID=UPI003D28D28C